MTKNDILLLLLQYMDERKFDTFSNEYLGIIIEIINIEFVKQFIKMFSNILNNRGNVLVNTFYNHNDADLIKFVTTMCVGEKII